MFLNFELDILKQSEIKMGEKLSWAAENEDQMYFFNVEI